MIVEAVCCSVADALSAERAGARRIEICSAIELGGLTPSIGLVSTIEAHCALPAVAMVRPRAGGFAYSASEIEVMQSEAAGLVSAGIKGLVFAALLPDRRVDVAACEAILGTIERACNRGFADEEAGIRPGKKSSLQLVFHRAFDNTPDLFESLEVLIGLGFTRILTSGGADTAVAGQDALRRLVDQAAGRIEILPAGRVRASNAAEILLESGATQLHLGPMRDVPDSTAPMYGGTFKTLDEDALRSVVDAVKL